MASPPRATPSTRSPGSRKPASAAATKSGRPLVERLGLGVLALVVVERRQVVEARSQPRVLRRKCFRRLKRGLELLLSLGVVASLVRRDTRGTVHFPRAALGECGCGPKSQTHQAHQQPPRLGRRHSFRPSFESCKQLAYIFAQFAPMISDLDIHRSANPL